MKYQIDVSGGKSFEIEADDMDEATRIFLEKYVNVAEIKNN